MLAIPIVLTSSKQQRIKTLITLNLYAVVIKHYSICSKLQVI
jgi:hypothetical protein